MKTDSWDRIYKDIKDELNKQITKWGIQHHAPEMWMNILMEEVGESSKAWMEHYFRNKDKRKYREELIQVAAVAIAAIEHFDRGCKK